MASLTRHPKSRFYTACYTDRLGKQVKRSTKVAERNKAMTIALELERVERKARDGLVTSVQLKKILNDVSERVTGEGIAAPAAQDYFGDWLKTVKTRNSPATWERYQNTVKHFLKSLGDVSKQPVTALTPSHLERFLTERLQSGAAPKTAIIDLKILNTALRRAENYGLILKNPVSAVPPPRHDSSEREVFTHEEVQNLIDAAPDVEWQTLIMLGYFTGARLGDCVTMTWENVRPVDGVIVYTQKKTHKRVVVPMHYHLIEHIEHLSTFGTDGFLCPKLASKGPGGKHGLSESFKRIAVRAGIDLMTGPGKGTRRFSKRTFHSLRHSFNSALANAGVSEEIRMKLTGHSSKVMNSRYTHLDVQPLKDAITSLPVFRQKETSADQV